MRRLIALFAPVVVWLACAPARAQPAPDAPCRPVQGDQVPALAALDEFMLQFLCDHDIGAAVVAVTRERSRVYNRAFGWSDEARTAPLAPDALMRIASVSKPITAAAVRELIEEGSFTLDSNVFDVGQPGGGLLDLEPHVHELVWIPIHRLKQQGRGPCLLR